MNIIFSIISHGQQSLVEQLLKSIDEFVITYNCSIKIVVTENFENDIYVNSSRFNVAKIINLRKKGFGENHNKVFEQSKCDYFFVINPDIEIKQTLEIDLLIEYMLAEKLDLASPVIVNHYGDVEDYKRSDVTFRNILKRALFRGRPEKFEWFAGMFLIFRSTSFRKLGGFDTKFFMYVEDCDLCMRARKLGMKLGDITFLSVVHHARRETLKSVHHLKWHASSLFKYWLKR
ncbi:glycosyltransferase [Amylibacter sp.]|nr:glycosyltransferase [Amylibacter sp.]